MKRIFSLLLFSVCGTALIVGSVVARSSMLSLSDVGGLFAGVFFTESTTPEVLREKYVQAERGGTRLRVLIVPGHDNKMWGTEFRGVREADMTAAVGEELSKLLSGNLAYEPILVRTREDYVPEFRAYFESEHERVRAFLDAKKKDMAQLVQSGDIHITRGVMHNKAPNTTAEKLYAVNVWANEHAVDIVLHLHFNDYPGRPRQRAGKYNGFSLYVPDRQYSNARASRAVAESIAKQFSTFYAESNLPVENQGIVADQELIALGSYNTLDPASVLLEYGYIYERRFVNEKVREAMMKELAFQTYQGLNRFFGRYGDAFQKYPTTLLPHNWQRTLATGVEGDVSVLSLQTALLLEELYPPAGENKRDCPMTGSFGPCTEASVKLFQNKHGLPQSGTVGPRTIEKLNEKYGR